MADIHEANAGAAGPSGSHNAIMATSAATQGLRIFASETIKTTRV